MRSYIALALIAAATSAIRLNEDALPQAVEITEAGDRPAGDREAGDREAGDHETGDR